MQYAEALGGALAIALAADETAFLDAPSEPHPVPGHS
jgi:hypothetical protein